MSATFDAFWKALETNKDLQRRLMGISSREDIANIAAEFGFIFPKNELDKNELLNNGYRLEWPSSNEETVKRVELTDYSKITIKELYIEVVKLRKQADEAKTDLDRINRFLDISPGRYTYRG